MDASGRSVRIQPFYVESASSTSALGIPVRNAAGGHRSTLTHGRAEAGAPQTHHPRMRSLPVDFPASPKVSICIPAYRQTEYLTRTLQSIAAQSFRDFEVVVTDDSEDDAVERLVDQFADRMEVRYVRNAERKGSPANWNEAISLARGEYVKILHHDDWFARATSLEEFVRLLDANPCADFGFSGSSLCGPNGAIKRHHVPTKAQLARLRKNAANLFPHNMIGAPSATIFRRSAPELFDVQLKWVVDLDFYIQVLTRNGRFGFIPEPLICTTGDAAHQVTRECVGNREVELFEWVYLFAKLERRERLGREKISFIWRLLGRHNAESASELRWLGLTGPLPQPLPLLLWLRRVQGALGFS